MADDTPGSHLHPPATGEGRGPRRAFGYGPTLLVGLVGAATVAVGVSRPWVSASSTQRGNPTLEATVSGAELAPLAGALGVVLLAAFGTVVATRGWVRRGLGVVIGGAAIVVAVAAVAPSSAGARLETGLSAVGWAGGDYATATEPWRWITLAGASLCLAAGAAVTAYGGRWATMGSRYDAPAAASGDDKQTTVEDPGELTESDVWREIDHGRDPTQAP